METQFEHLIEGIIAQKFGMLPGFFSKEVVEELRGNLLNRHAAGLMHPAGVGKNFTYQKNTKVRGDLISWLDENSRDPAERIFLDTVQQFCKYLNQTCFTGINGFEFHYALYKTGSFYKRHLDQFHLDRGRKFSMVTYLNEDWRPEYGGELVLYLEEGEVVIPPEAGKVVFFKADEIEHEVRPALRERMSIAGWLLSL